MIPREGVHKTEELMFGGGINFQINLWQRKIIFWTHFVEVGEVNTYSPLFSIFWGDDNGGEPISVVRFSDDIYLD